MTFDKQVEKAKEEKLKYRITRDVIFIVLGITFLVISIFVSYSDSKKESNNTGKKTTTVVDKLKEINKDKKTKLKVVKLPASCFRKVV